jgi:hypothetical protein
MNMLLMQLSGASGVHTRTNITILNKMRNVVSSLLCLEITVEVSEYSSLEICQLVLDTPSFHICFPRKKSASIYQTKKRRVTERIISL